MVGLNSSVLVIELNISREDVGQWWPAAGLRALRAVMYAWDLYKEIPIIFITSYIVWPQVK